MTKYRIKTIDELKAANANIWVNEDGTNYDVCGIRKGCYDQLGGKIFTEVYSYETDNDVGYYQFCEDKYRFYIPSWAIEIIIDCGLHNIKTMEGDINA